MKKVLFLIPFLLCACDDEKVDTIMSLLPQNRALPSGDWTITEQYGPLIRTKWHQGAPFNNACNGNLVGCVGLAMAQIVAYKQYPVITTFSQGICVLGLRLIINQYQKQL